MFKQLRTYYIVVSLPFALLLLGSTVFFSAIKSTIVRNPHPQINYAIFVIVLVGGVLILLSAGRLIREARTLMQFVDDKSDPSTLQLKASHYLGELSCLLQMVAASVSRSISHQEQVAIEHELASTRERLVRRNALPQYLSGLLVGMGLLGTFIGLLATLNDISTLISSFADLDMNNVNPIQIFRVMIERMKAPMQSMGIAFSASMFGLLGSIVLGLMMMGIRRLQGDIIALLGTEVARHIEIALSYEDAVPATRTSAVGDDTRVMSRIEERLAEALRLQQRAISTEIEEFQRQRADILQILAEQTAANSNVRSELQQLVRQCGAVVTAIENGNSELSAQVSELTVQTTSGTRQSHELLAMQMDEQKRLRSALDAYKVEERLADALRLQQRALSTAIDDFQKQRADMLHTLVAQTEASNAFRSELQQFGRQLGAVVNLMEKSNSETNNQFAELLVHLAADAKESHKLLTLQIDEQRFLRETLDGRAN